MDKFNLVDFLRKNLKPKEFERGEYNHYIVFDSKKKYWCIGRDGYNERVSHYFENVKENVVLELNANKVKPSQMIEAFKELGW